MVSQQDYDILVINSEGELTEDEDEVKADGLPAEGEELGEPQGEELEVGQHPEEEFEAAPQGDEIEVFTMVCLHELGATWSSRPRPMAIFVRAIRLILMMGVWCQKDAWQ